MFIPLCQAQAPYVPTSVRLRLSLSQLPTWVMLSFPLSHHESGSGLLYPTQTKIGVRGVICQDTHFPIKWCWKQSVELSGSFIFSSIWESTWVCGLDMAAIEKEHKNCHPGCLSPLPSITRVHASRPSPDLSWTCALWRRMGLHLFECPALLWDYTEHTHKIIHTEHTIKNHTEHKHRVKRAEHTHRIKHTERRYRAYRFQTVKTAIYTSSDGGSPIERRWPEIARLTGGDSFYNPVASSMQGTWIIHTAH